MDATVPPVALPATAAGGAQTLSAADQVLLATTILLFLVLSVVSGRAIQRQYALDRDAALAASGGARAANSASASTSASQPARASYASIPLGAAPAAFDAHAAAASNASPSATLLGREGSASASIGTEMRHRLFLLMFLASVLRVASLVTEVASLQYIEPLPSTLVVCRLLAAFLWLPSMVFVSMYGLVLLFWAQLCYACWGKSHPWPRRLFFAFNVALYVAFAALIALRRTSHGLWRACDLLQGGLYFGALFGIVYYSVRLIYFFRHQGQEEEVFFDLPTTISGKSSRPRNSFVSPRQAVLRRIAAVCALLCVLFAVKSVYLIGRGTGVMYSEEAQDRTPVGVRYIASEFLLHFFTEFVPCAMLLYFTKQGKDKTAETQQVGRLASDSFASPSFSGGYSISREKLAALAKPYATSGAESGK